MKWRTRSHLHLDRTASAWLISEFIDQEAEFTFVAWDVSAGPEDERAFGIPGSALAPHDEEGTGFRAILRKYDLADDSGLGGIERAVDAGVRYALAKPQADSVTEVEQSVGRTLDACGLAWSATHDDYDHLAAATPMLNALHSYFSLGNLTDLPSTQPERVTELRARLPLQRTPR